MDETCVSLSPEATHANGQAIISAHAGDEGQTLHSKGLPRSTLVYARNGAGQLLPSMVVCGGRAKLPDNFPRVDLLAEAPRQSEGEGDADVPQNVVDTEGVPLKTHWTANKWASLNTELLIEWADECLFPSLRVGGLKRRESRDFTLRRRPNSRHVGFHRALFREQRARVLENTAHYGGASG